MTEEEKIRRVARRLAKAAAKAAKRELDAGKPVKQVAKKALRAVIREASTHDPAN